MAWIKLLGSALVVVAPATIGFQLSGELSRRPKLLRELAVGLSRLESEVAFTATPLPDALLAAGSAGPVAAALFGGARSLLGGGDGLTAGDAFAQALKETLRGTPLTDHDLAALAPLASVLGATDQADQVRHLRLCQERLRGLEAEAIERRDRLERVPKTVGVLAGLGLALILL